MENLNRTFCIANKEITIVVSLDEIVDYSAEYGFTSNDEEYREGWFGVNVLAEINNENIYGQIQFDDTNNMWSLSCDRNEFGQNIAKAVLNCFSADELYVTHLGSIHDYTIESDLHCDIENNLIPEICKEIANFGKEAFVFFK